jgi:hypothetical protein
MSFEAFVQCFKDGESAGIPRQQIREAFGSFLSDRGDDWHLFYDAANSCDVMLTIDDTEETLVQGFTVTRPCGDERFWDSMASILRLGNVVLYFPASCPPLIADASVAQHLPPNMIEAMGQPKRVTSGKEILKVLHAA